MLLASAWGCSKQEAARRAVISAAARMLDTAEVQALARNIVPEYRATEARIRQARA